MEKKVYVLYRQIAGLPLITKILIAAILHLAIAVKLERPSDPLDCYNCEETEPNFIYVLRTPFVYMQIL